ncbi:MAG: hypothetical protein DME60_11450 [Verrucomicrobia bacterium]|nr:MAG: hypothetical protein DME60_11450 [Verrucomicrobiota bacterium]
MSKHEVIASVTQNARSPRFGIWPSSLIRAFVIRASSFCESPRQEQSALRSRGVDSWSSRYLNAFAPGQFSASLRIHLKEMDVTPARPAGKLFLKA